MLKKQIMGQITNIKNDYATKAILDSKINELKSQHISHEIKKVYDKVKKNITDILSYKNSLDHSKGVINDLEREISYFRVKDYYLNYKYHDINRYRYLDGIGVFYDSTNAY